MKLKYLLSRKETMKTSLSLLALALIGVAPLSNVASAANAASVTASPATGLHAERVPTGPLRSPIGTSLASPDGSGLGSRDVHAAIAAPYASLAPRNFSEALAVQKMLAHRVGHAYARAGVLGEPAGGTAQLAAAVADFSTGLTQLEALLPGTAPRPGTQDPVRQSIWALAGQWADAQPLLAERPTIHSALRLAGKMDGTLATIDRLGVELADQTDAAATTSVGALLARQAELSQRIARAYWLRRLGDDSTAGRDELEAAERAMRANLAMLSAHPERQAQDVATLERIETEVSWLLAAIESDGAESFPLVVSAAVEQVVAQVADFGATLVARP